MASLVSITIATILLVGFAAAIPKPTSSEADNTLVKRANIQDCKYGGDYHGKFVDGTGTYSNSDSVRHSFRSKCWNDYFLVTQAKVKRPWKPSGTNAWCTGTFSCAIAEVKGEQFCRSVTDQLSNDIGVSIMNISLKLGVTHSVEAQNCYQGSTTTTCTWNDKGCHTVWTQQEIVHQEGYKRKRCNEGHGDYTDCMSDWVQEFATDTRLNYGCGSKCTDTNDCGRTDGRPCPKSKDNTKQLKSIDSTDGSSDAKPLSQSSSKGTSQEAADGQKDTNDQPAKESPDGSPENSSSNGDKQDSGATDDQKDPNESNADETNPESSTQNSDSSTNNESQDSSSSQQDNTASNDGSTSDTSQSTDNTDSEGTPVENQDSLQDGSSATDNTDTTSSDGQDSTQATTDQANSGNDQSSTNDNAVSTDGSNTDTGLPIDDGSGNQNTGDDSLASTTDNTNVDGNVPVDDGSGDSSITNDANTDTTVPSEESTIDTTNDQSSTGDDGSGMSNMLADQGSAGDTGDGGSGDGSTTSGDDGSGGGF